MDEKEKVEQKVSSEIFRVNKAKLKVTYKYNQKETFHNYDQKLKFQCYLNLCVNHFFLFKKMHNTYTFHVAEAYPK